MVKVLPFTSVNTADQTVVLLNRQTSIPGLTIVTSLENHSRPSIIQCAFVKAVQLNPVILILINSQTAAYGIPICH